MKNILRFLFISLCCLFVLQPSAFSREKVKGSTKSSNTIKQIAAACEPGSDYKYLDLNNVRTLIYSYGNGWFLEDGEYEIPKGSRKISMFSFSLWIGGIDINNNLKLAAYRYGQGPNTAAAHTKNDFWPGPLTIDGTAAIEADVCAQYDHLYPITRPEVQEFLAWWGSKDEYPDYQIPRSILEWPAHGDRAKGQAYYLAPFFDEDGDGTYDPYNGDYPYYDLDNSLCPTNLKPGERLARAHLRNGEATDTLGILVDQVIKGDQTLWSVYNDKGNYHSETEGEPIGMEIRAQYFSFATNDEINDMTFYSYEVINRSTYTLTGTYFSQWVDPDLGWYQDDYVGCDVKRGLGYCYNGLPIDGTGQIQAYGAHPPAVGVDFFQGPYMDPDQRDNPRFTGDCSILTSEYPLDQMAINGAPAGYGDGIVDNERFGMRRFVYHNNSLSGVPWYMQDPDYAPEYYLFLRGIWKDQTKMLYGGNAHQGAGADGPECDFMFPGDTDVCDWGTAGQPPNGEKYWTEETAGNNPSDRRFMQSAGPFTLHPGACNYITVGIPWARTIAGTPWDAVGKLRVVDDLCQSLFDNCFAVLNGPNAPDLTIQEMNKKLIIYITNRKINDAGNNYQERYVEYDPNIPNPDTLPHNQRNDSLYRFEGYIVYQLKDATVSAADLGDPTKARQVFQCDIKNNVTKLVNWTFNQDLGGNVGEVMVDGSNEGILHSFILENDAFATGDLALINHKQYYFMAIAYAYNEFKVYNPITPEGLDGQKLPFLSGRSNLKSYTGIPHIPLNDIPNSSYGEGPTITRIQGQGNGGKILYLDPATTQEILSKPPADSTNQYGGPDYPIAYKAKYLTGYGPLNVKVVDPLNVIASDYILAFDSMVPGPPNPTFTNPDIRFGNWMMIDTRTGNVYTSDTTTIYPYEQLFLDLGIAVEIAQIPNPGDTLPGAVHADNNGLLSAPPAVYEDPSHRWLSGVPDWDNPPGLALNWIRSGTYNGGGNSATWDWDMSASDPWDPNKNYQQIQVVAKVIPVIGNVSGGTWAPYSMCAFGQQMRNGPAYSSLSKKLNKLFNLASVDIVITPDKNLWTRAPVVEMCPDSLIAEGRARQYDLRKGKSVNVDGDTGVVHTEPMYNSNYISDYGMGWFPGYAINLETGERLNIMFGENSWQVADNGRDMLWNPTSNMFDLTFNPVFGGQHYVYIMAHRDLRTPALDTFNLNFPAYDAGQNLFDVLKMEKKMENIYKTRAYASAMWVNIPLSVDGEPWLSNRVEIAIRVAKPYQRYYSEAIPDSIVDTAQNRAWPLYIFNTDAIATSKNNYSKMETDLDLINVVPNPYYAYDDYERNQLDNRIKIVNLPTKCTVTIYDLSGTVIRQFKVDKAGITLPRASTAGLNTDAKTSVDWDMKNFAGIPIAGGVYLIHVKADGLGERTLKWFGILRPIDLNSL
ncbi:MAG: T9SS C-terminal target domain-containing protein [Bacteroidetes bacterium]|nr:T9SS C-terminal target domain-containing protein [Bacteroidota bacterium]